MFLVIERGGFAGGADGHDAIHTALDLEFDQAFERDVVEQAVLFEGRYDGGVGAAKWELCLHWPENLGKATRFGQRFFVRDGGIQSALHAERPITLVK
jgi:hypothetical protein